MNAALSSMQLQAIPPNSDTSCLQASLAMPTTAQLMPAWTPLLNTTQCGACQMQPYNGAPGAQQVCCSIYSHHAGVWACHAARCGSHALSDCCCCQSSTAKELAGKGVKLQQVQRRLAFQQHC